jgi:hypothetical protein
MKDLHSSAIACRSFYPSANKALYSHVTITASAEGNVRMLSKFLKTVIKNSSLVRQVKKLTVRFYRRNLTPLVTCDKINLPDRKLFESALLNFGIVFSLISSEKHFIAYSVLLRLLLSQLTRLNILDLDYSRFHSSNYLDKSLVGPNSVSKFNR